MQGLALLNFPGNDSMSVSPEPPRAALQPLLTCFNARRYDEMERLARLLLQDYPDAGDVWKALAISLQAQGKDAVPSLQRAIQMLPGDAELPSNLGNLLSQQGRHEQALQCYQEALALRPDFAEAHGNLGLALMRMGRLESAIHHLQRAVEIKPAFAEGHCNLGIALRLAGQYVAAEHSLERAIAVRSSFLQAHLQLGRVHQACGRFDQASSSFRRVLELQAGHVEAQFELAISYGEAGRRTEAIACYRQLLLSQPAHTPACCNLGLLLQAEGQAAEAMHTYQSGLRHAPESSELINNLGNLMKSQGCIDEAVQLYRRAIAQRKDDLLAYGNLAVALRERADFAGAADCYEHILAFSPRSFASHSDLLFLHCHSETMDAAAARSAAQAYGQRVSTYAVPYRHWLGSFDPERRLRIGLLSPDLREHPVGFFLHSVIAALATTASSCVELVAYDGKRSAEDRLSASFRQMIPQWHSVQQLDDAQLAAKIHADQIDILVDLSGHTVGNRLPVLAYRPAPVQMTWLGYCGSTGVPTIDYFLADPWIAPAGMEAAFTEHLWRMPDTFLCFTPPDIDLSVGTLPAGSSKQITFGCFNKLNKLGEEVLTVWAGLLQSVHNSRLYLKNGQLAYPRMRESLLMRFAAKGIAKERIVLEGPSSRDEYLECYRKVDIALDPFPYPGGTTSLEALWMGVPVLTLGGRSALSRQGLSIMQNLGMQDWIAGSHEEYIALAQQHASDLPKLQSLRATLRQRLLTSPLCDAQAFATQLESAWRQMWAERCRKPQSPDESRALQSS